MGISAIRQALTGPVIFAFLGLIFSLFSFALMFYYSIELGRIGTVLVLFAVLITALAAYIQVRYQRAISNVQGNLSGTLLQFLTSISKLPCIRHGRPGVCGLGGWLQHAASIDLSRGIGQWRLDRF